MVKVIEENFMVCCDCLSAIACDDYTGLDYHYNESEAEKRMEEIKRGIENAGGYIVYGDSDNDLEFSQSSCDCCGSRLAGSRHHFIVMEY